MKITIESTATIALVDGTKARLWAGTTEAGVPVNALITAISPQTLDPAVLAAFERELPLRDPPPRITELIDPRFII